MLKPKPAAALVLDGVTAGYGGLTILRDISLRLLPGHMVTVVGPNGHGKSTLLKTISGMTQQSSGRIWPVIHWRALRPLPTWKSQRKSNCI